MPYFSGPRSPYRFLKGLLLLSLPRRLIPSGLCDLAAGCTDDPLPEPVGHAHSCQGGSLPDQGVMLWQEPYPDRR
jgi:hypothetical protein